MTALPAPYLWDFCCLCYARLVIVAASMRNTPHFRDERHDHLYYIKIWSPQLVIVAGCFHYVGSMSFLLLQLVAFATWDPGRLRYVWLPPL